MGEVLLGCSDGIIRGFGLYKNSDSYKRMNSDEEKKYNRKHSRLRVIVG
jgi:hypothetical protein